MAYGRLAAVVYFCGTPGHCVELASSQRRHWDLIFNQGGLQLDRGANRQAGLGSQGTRWEHKNVSRKRSELWVRDFETTAAGGAGNKAVVAASQAGGPWRTRRGQRKPDLLGTYHPKPITR